MRIVLQRVRSASVEVDGQRIGKITRGLLLLVGFGKEEKVDALARSIDKILNLRIFPDEQGRFQHSLIDIGGQVLLVPQFTLFADTTKGRRPDFFSAMDPKPAQDLFEQYTKLFNQSNIHVETGKFGAEMLVTLENDGPVTLWLEF